MFFKNRIVYWVTLQLHIKIKPRESRASSTLIWGSDCYDGNYICTALFSLNFSKDVILKSWILF